MSAVEYVLMLCLSVEYKWLCKQDIRFVTIYICKQDSEIYRENM
jgi:hypothetical protein